MVTVALLMTLLSVPPALERMKVNAPAADALMLLARHASLNLMAAPLTGRVKGELPVSNKEVLVRTLLAQVDDRVVRREDFIFVGKAPPARNFPKVALGGGPISYLWEKEISAGQLATLLSLSLKRPVAVAAPHDRELLSVVLTQATADEAVAALAFFLGLPIEVAADGSVSIGEPGTAVTRDCVGFSLTEWTRLTAYVPGPYPLGLLQTGGTACPTETGRTVRTADGELVKSLGPDGDALLFTWVTGARAGRYAKITFDTYAEIPGCTDIARDAALVRTNAGNTFAVLRQGLVECGVSRGAKAGEFVVQDLDANGPYVRKVSAQPGQDVKQVGVQGSVPAVAPIPTR
ncbi:MAG: hypothetical protein FJ086_03340 [Deltaproteobacteria bacterium]|nr:hypothetical protein [Deltaproteobacteria bacterium]